MSAQDIIRLDSTELVSPDGGDRLLALLARIFDDPEIVAAVHEFRAHIVEALLSYGKPLEGVDMLSEDGTFVRDGIEARLQKARSDLRGISAEMVIGGVELLESDSKLLIGNLRIPHSSDWARQHFINTNPIIGGDRYVFVPYRVSEYIDPHEVTPDSKGAFLLSKREEVAAQVLMVTHAAMGYRNLVVACMEEADITGPVLSRMKIDANRSDLMDALHYALRLPEELRLIPKEDPNVRMIKGMSESGRFLTAASATPPLS